jgi:hypothetical protein
MRNCKCGNAVADNARSCPKCGHRFTSGPVLALAWFFGIVGVVAFIGMSSNSGTNAPSPPTPSPTQQAAKKKEDADFQRAVLGAKQLQASMRNPDSFKLSQVLIMDDGAVCYDYRAQNGFGGMNLGHGVLSPKNQFKSNQSSGFASLWNKECANKTGTVQTWEVGYAAGFHGLLDK